RLTIIATGEPRQLTSRRASKCHPLIPCEIKPNSARRELLHPIDDPLEYLTNRTVVSHLDGAITGTDPETRKLILQLDLDSPVMRKWRHQWIRIVQLASDHDEELLEQLTRFPDDLPNLARRRPPTNNAPEGIPRSWHARRERGELPRSY
ncbi:hypothetical protein, partial [Rhodopirellula bahusiensis]